MDLDIQIKLFQKKVNGKNVDWPEWPHRNVFLGKQRIAYCGCKPGMPINFLKDVGEDIKQAVKAKAEAHLGGEAGRMVNPAPVVEDEGHDNDD